MDRIDRVVEGILEELDIKTEDDSLDYLGQKALDDLYNSLHDIVIRAEMEIGDIQKKTEERLEVVLEKYYKEADEIMEKEK